MSTTVVIKPAGVRDENIGVLIFAIVTLSLAAWYISFSASVAPAHVSVGSNQMDARHDLNPIEQGLYADLLAASEEILWRIAEHEDVSLNALDTEFIPPFVKNAVSIERGQHNWHLLTHPDDSSTDHWLYSGSTSDASIAGSFVLLIEQHDSENPPETSIWYLNKQAPAFNSWPTTSMEMHLSTSGWKQVVSLFDASVTRPGN